MFKVVEVRGKGWEDLRKQVVKDSDGVGRLANFVSATVGAEGRRASKHVFDRTLQMGNWNEKYYKGTHHRGGTVFDPTVGGYVSRFKEQKDVYFSFEKKASRRSRGAMGTALSQVRMTSKVANLWEHDTLPYKKQSPLFNRYGFAPGLWTKGTIRTGRNFFLTDVYNATDASIPSAVERAWKKAVTEGWIKT